MGKVGSKFRGALVTRPAQRFNIESRTDRLLDQDVVTARPAPKFPSDANLLDQIRANNPEISEAAKKKDVELHTRLKSVI